MQYIKIHIDYGCRNYCQIIQQIDNAISVLLNALADKILDSDVAGYKLNTGQTNVEVTLKNDGDITNQIMRLEKLREDYVNLAQRSKFGRKTILKDQNNFR